MQVRGPQGGGIVEVALGTPLRELVDQPNDKLLQSRYDKFRQMGQFLDPAV